MQHSQSNSPWQQTPGILAAKIDQMPVQAHCRASLAGSLHRSHKCMTQPLDLYLCQHLTGAGALKVYSVQIGVKTAAKWFGNFDLQKRRVRAGAESDRTALINHFFSPFQISVINTFVWQKTRTPVVMPGTAQNGFKSRMRIHQG